MICTAAHRGAIDLLSAQKELPILANTIGNGLEISHPDVPGMYSVQENQLLLMIFGA